MTWLVRCSTDRAVSSGAVLGVAEAEWEVKPHSPDVAESHYDFPGNAGAARRDGLPFLQHTLKQVWLLDEPWVSPGGYRFRTGPVGAHAVATECVDRRFCDGSLSLDDVVRLIGLCVFTFIVVPGFVAAGLQAGYCETLVASLILGPRLPDGGVAGGVPATALIRRIRKSLGVLRGRPATALGPETYSDHMARYSDALLALPRSLRDLGVRRGGCVGRADKDDLRGDRDPCAMIRGLVVKQYLRAGRFFSTVMAASRRYDAPDDPSRDASHDPHWVTLDRASAKLDIMDLLLERRAFRADRKFDTISSIHLYSDASPVTGEELQGMLMDVCYKSGQGRRLTLPGASLAYGLTGAVSKSIALLWSIYLLAGPFLVDLRYVVSKVGSILTDAGTERHTLEMPDVLEAFVAWAAGATLAACAALVVHDRRLFANAASVIGWNHGWANLMKYIAKVCPSWSHVEDQLRTLVAFWRNKTYRRWVMDALAGVPAVDPKLFKSFRATIAKWRFATIPECMEALLLLRSVCEHHLREEMFANAQDRVMIQSVMAACKDKLLWIFMKASLTHVFRHCERGRRWGTTCLCPDHVRMREVDGVKHIECFHNSRKLKPAWSFLTDFKQEVFDRGCSITPADTEGNHDIWMLTKTMLWSTMQGVDLRFGTLGFVPLAIARCDSVAGATEFMRQLRAKPWQQHDPLTRQLADAVGGDIQRRSEGGEVTPALQEAVDRACEIPLNEQPGEGYHRATNLEQRRAPASTSQHIKAMTRFKPTLAKTEKFMETHGDRGSAVVRFEWRAWKRIIQTDVRKQWQPVHKPSDEVFARIYREDAKAREDFSSICSRLPPSCSMVPEKVSGQEALRNEYLVATLQDNSVYSVSQAKPKEPGMLVQPPDRVTHFQLLERAYGNRRPDYASMAMPGADVALQAGLALLVVFLKRRRADDADPSDEGLDPQHVCAESGPTWVRPHDICLAGSWYSKLHKCVALAGHTMPLSSGTATVPL